MAFEDVAIEENGSNGNTGDFKETVYMKAKVDFPLGKAQEHRIIDAHVVRQLFQGKKPTCVSFDGKVGRTPASAYKDTVECDGCEWRKGVVPETGGEPVKCQYKLAIILEHEDADKEYQIKVSYGSHIEFAKYLKDLGAEGLSPDTVMTKITRNENPDGPGGLYEFDCGLGLISYNPRTYPIYTS
ncbi:hypothetical protein HNV12_17935 [Methanococcoides sp. SA1]|nr:hypothetical protein [Methanococcoides sp. SA1]